MPITIEIPEADLAGFNDQARERLKVAASVAQADTQEFRHRERREHRDWEKTERPKLFFFLLILKL